VGQDAPHGGCVLWTLIWLVRHCSRLLWYTIERMPMNAVHVHIANKGRLVLPKEGGTCLEWIYSTPLATVLESDVLQCKAPEGQAFRPRPSPYRFLRFNVFH